MRSSSWLLTNLLALACVQAGAAPPADLEIAFEVRRDDAAIADVVHRLQHDGKTYQLRETWSGRGLYRLAGLIQRESRGLVGPGGLRSVEYVDERTGRRTERARFDWEANTVTLEHRGETRSMALPSRAIDRLALVYDFSFDTPKGAPMAVHVVDGRRMTDQVFRPEGRERLKTPAGEFAVLKYVRRKPNGERGEIWLAEDHAYIPVRIVVVDEGSKLDQVVTRISGF